MLKYSHMLEKGICFKMMKKPDFVAKMGFILIK